MFFFFKMPNRVYRYIDAPLTRALEEWDGKGDCPEGAWEAETEYATELLTQLYEINEIWLNMKWGKQKRQEAFMERQRQ